MASFLVPSAEAELTSGDFAGLSYTDPEGDDYTFFWEGELSGVNLDYKKSWGKRGENPSIDIVSLQAALDSNNVSVTMECAGAIDLDYDMDYMVFFVESDHDPSDYSGFNIILNPKDYKASSLSYEYMDAPNVIVYFGYNRVTDEGDVLASSYLPSLTGYVDGNTITLNVSSEDLEDAGVVSDSGFGVYGFVNRIESGGAYYTATWDSAGLGAVPAPAEFEADSSENGNKGGSESPFANWILILIIAIIAILMVLFFLLKNSKGEPRALYPQQPILQPIARPPQPDVSTFYCRHCGKPFTAKIPEQNMVMSCPSCGGQTEIGH